MTPDRDVLNGRFGYKSSKHTFRDLSVIDYTVCSIDGYKYVDYFNVIPKIGRAHV